MQALINRTVAAQSDNRIVLKNGQLKRKFGFADDWTQLRIGILCAFDASATVFGDPKLVLGVCNYAGGGFGNASAGHVVGVRYASTSFIYAAGPPTVLTPNAPNPRSFKKVGMVVTDSASPAGGGYVLSASPNTVRCAILIEITKGTPDFTIIKIGPSTSAGAGNNITDAQFDNAMLENPFTNIPGGTGSFAGLGYVQRATGAIAVDEVTDGVLNAFHLYWERTSAAFEVAHIRFRKTA